MSSKGSSGPDPLSHMILGEVGSQDSDPGNLQVLRKLGPHLGKRGMLGEGNALGFYFGGGGKRVVKLHGPGVVKRGEGWESGAAVYKPTG